MFILGQNYKRADLHKQYGGQRQGGISTPKEHPFVFLFTGEEGQRYGYRDEWEAGLFHYTGEGQSGDMEYTRGNKAIVDHIKNGKTLYLFEQSKKGLVRFKGQFSLVGLEERQNVDKNSKSRRVIIFQLTPVSFEADVSDVDPFPLSTGVSPAVDLDGLRKRAHEASLQTSKAIAQDSRRRYYERSKVIRRYVLARSQGKCEVCQKPSPFNRTDGSFYLEPHHTQLISESGLDHPRWVGAVCPNCHREIHHGMNGQQLNEVLKRYISDRES